MSNKMRIKTLELLLEVANAQSLLSINDLAFSLQRDYAISVRGSRIVAPEIRRRSRIAADSVRQELKSLTDA
jgi:hypothetical protein